MKRFFTVLTIAFGLIVSNAPARAESADGPSGQLIKPSPTTTTTGADVADKVAKVPTAADDQRTSKILNSLAVQSGWFPSVKIGVTGGVVSLEGHTKDAEQLAWLAKTADRLPTVIAVINKTTVDQPPVTDLSPAWNEFMRLVNKAKRSLPLLLLAAALVAAFWFFGRYISQGVQGLWSRQINNPFLLSTVSKITMIPIWLLGFYLVLQTAGLSGLASTIIGGTGAVGIVLGFAFKDIAENYISGLLLAIRSPFTKGDDVNIAGYDGYVQALNMRGTTILAYDGTLILVPNSIVIKSVIQNRTTNPRSRFAFDVGIGYNDSADKAVSLIYQALKEIPGVLQEPAPLAVATELKDSYVNIRVMFWIDVSKSSIFKTKSSAIASTKEILMANGISLPDSAREIVFTDTLKIQQVASNEEQKSMQDQRRSETRAQAEANLKESRASNSETPKTDHETELKRLAGDVDIMHTAADRELVKNASI